MSSTEMEISLYSINEVAKMLRVSDKKVRSLIKNGEIPYVTVGHRYRFCGWQIKEWLDKQKAKNLKKSI